MQPLAEWPQDRRTVSDSDLVPTSGPDKSISPGPATNVPTFENRVTPTVGAGREVMDMAGQNVNSAAYAFEERVSQGNLLSRVRRACPALPVLPRHGRRPGPARCGHCGSPGMRLLALLRVDTAARPGRGLHLVAEVRARHVPVARGAEGLARCQRR